MRRVIAAPVIALLALAISPRLSGQVVTRLSVDSSGAQANSSSYRAMLSLDGEVVSFTSDASNLVAGDTNLFIDVFVRLVDSGVTERVSVDSAGTQANDSSSVSSINADGSLVAFTSYATNLVAGDTNGSPDIFVRDRSAGLTTRISLDSSGAQANGGSANPAISTYDGRYVAFDSGADNLVAGDTNNDRDIFLHDRSTGTTTRISVSSSGGEGNDDSIIPTISGEGRYVAYVSAASNLVPGDTNGVQDVFLYDTVTATTTRISVDSSGNQGNNWSVSPDISGNGEVVAFSSLASNLVAGDTNGTSDFFVHKWVTGETTRVNVSSGGAQANLPSGSGSISSQALRVAFVSQATNLVPGDTNGDQDIFVHDLPSGETIRVSTDADGIQGNDWSSYPTLDLTGASVAFQSYADNLVPGDTNATNDTFLHRSPSVAFPLQPATGDSVAFTLHDAPDQVGHQAFFLLSCSGTDGFQLGSRTVPLTFDACTQFSIAVALVLMDIVDQNGNASSPPFIFPQLPPGIVLYIAGVTRGPAGFSMVTGPLIVRPR